MTRERGWDRRAGSLDTERGRTGWERDARAAGARGTRAEGTRTGACRVPVSPPEKADTLHRYPTGSDRDVARAAVANRHTQSTREARSLMF